MSNDILSFNIFQGEVKFLTGGNHFYESPRALFFEKVSRFGEIPKPTVTVRMKEDRENYVLKYIFTQS